MSVTKIDVPLEGLTSRPPVSVEEEIRRRLSAERDRLSREAGLDSKHAKHFHRPIERAFTAAERDRVTILIGGLTWKHEKVMKAVFEACGYKCDVLPTPDVAAFQLGKEYGNNGQCNPTYFTVGNLVQYLQLLESAGVPKQDILDNYVFFTAGSCGPCRFGMYESEYRLALQNAGYDGFRVLLFQQNDGVKAASGEPGLKFTVDFGMGMFNALNMGDIMNEMIFRIRPFEVNKGQTDRVFQESVDKMCAMLKERKPFEDLEDLPKWASSYLAKHKNSGWEKWVNSLGKVWEHLYGNSYKECLQTVHDHLATIEVDRLRIKPVVKIIGEFWAQTTEGDGNFNMFAFLEREGAQVLVEPIATWVMYMMYQVKERWREKKPLEVKYKKPAWWELRKHAVNELNFQKKIAMLSVGEMIYSRQYHRVVEALGDIAHHLIDQKAMADLAMPFYNQFARGGEGHLEVGKNIYYTKHKLCHMVLALKPFGCMPSTQSDGAQSAVANAFKDMIFLPIETSGEGEINAHSRVQMALGEAKVKARMEFDEALKSTGKSLEEIKSYVADHPELRQLFYPMPHREGVTGMAANFVLHVSDLINGRKKLYRVPIQARALAAAS
ncbi:MAG: activator of (R)-2-hydroxyglutaryl-CoA dehydratase [Acidobacteria bacterium]|nr:MAG: activator of (R)-2-hydroxyglutaryl-CoA dehydratase [Acidobacteriota bacterium]PYY24532.1 MAG: activator of (R)-2-hydroxyglutaryl-CoA dehydratase [Acidobacteriota bacterium]